MQSKLPMHQSPRCHARTRTGTPCQSPAMANQRCRMHGGKALGAPMGNSNALKHGRFTATSLSRRRQIGELIRTMKGLVDQADGLD